MISNILEASLLLPVLFLSTSFLMSLVLDSTFMLISQLFSPALILIMAGSIENCSSADIDKRYYAICCYLVQYIDCELATKRKPLYFNHLFQSFSIMSDSNRH